MYLFIVIHLFNVFYIYWIQELNIIYLITYDTSNI